MIRAMCVAKFMDKENTDKHAGIKRNRENFAKSK